MHRKISSHQRITKNLLPVIMNDDIIQQKPIGDEDDIIF